VELVRNGRIGRVQWVRSAIDGGPVCGWVPNEPPPEGLDWDFWLGPALEVPYNPKRFFGNFRWFYEYSGGKMTDWGAHHNDIGQWALGMDHSGPVKVEPLSAGFPTDGLFDTAVTFNVKHTYANGAVMYTTSEGNGVHFQGTDGWIKVNRGRFEASHPEIEKEPFGAPDFRLPKTAGHHQNWLECIRTRRRPVADVEIGCRTVTTCHLGTIAIRTGKTILWDPAREQVTNDPSLNRWLHKPYRAPWRV
jgi:predicted dehydrogenase